MKPIIYICLIFVIGSSACSEHYELVGKYKSYEPVIGKVKGNVYTLGNSLVISEDSTFIYTTCYLKSEGSYKVKNDSLFLFCSNVTHITNNEPVECGDYPEVFKINGEELLQQIKLKDIGEAYVALKKVK